MRLVERGRGKLLILLCEARVLKQRPNKSKIGRKAETKKPPGPNPGAEAPMPLSPRRNWIFRLIALAVLPLLLLGGLEFVLRLSGCGYPTGFFEKIRAGEGEFLVNNENFSLRFFPPQLARSPSPVMLEAKKPANTYRIFILGESAARGDPQMPYAASRYLETLLDGRFPNTRFEVVNLGITGISSHVILPIARDCARAGGDLWIIYMGNNEMVGPFGAATVFGAKAPPLGFVRLNLAIQRTRIGQLLTALGRKFKGENTFAAWGGMKMFLGNQIRAEDPRKEVVYQNFQRNLDDIVRAGLDSGAKILLNTVAVNLKDCPPFASLANTNLPPPDRAQFDQLYAQGCSAQAQNLFADASRKFAQAAKLDPEFPELRYRWGQCALALSDFAAARAHFQKACDVDALPFRADSRINGAIEKTGRQFAGDKLAFFDAAAWLAAETSEKLCGQETFYEHVHFNFEGNFRLGRAWAQQVEKMLPPEISGGAGASAWASQEICERRLGLTDWNRFATAQLVLDHLHQPPLSGQPNNAQRLLALGNEAGALRRRMNPSTAAAAAAIYQQAIQQSPRDHFLAENFAQFLEVAGDLKQAAVQWQRDCQLLPYDCTSYYQAGRLFSALGQWADAEAALNRAVTLRPRLTEAWGVLGNVRMATERFELALHDYERAAQLDPLAATYCAYIGTALSKLNRHAEAIQRYRQAVQMQPDLWPARFALGDELTAANQIEDAKNEYAELVRLKPGDALAHLGLGAMQARLGLTGDALQQFEETLRLEPGNQQARQFIDHLQNGDNRRR
jgi:tetratricopeptide (TPR) repeat protein